MVRLYAHERELRFRLCANERETQRKEASEQQELHAYQHPNLKNSSKEQNTGPPMSHHADRMWTRPEPRVPRVRFVVFVVFSCSFLSCWLISQKTYQR